MDPPNSVVLLLTIFLLPLHAMGANVVIFPILTKSQLLSASRLAEILHDDGNKVTIVMPTHDLVDIKPSNKFDILTYDTELPREEEQLIRKENRKSVF